MRVLLGLVLGCLLTIGAAYLYDSHNAMASANTAAKVERPLVNWDVVAAKWQQLTARARAEWHHLAD